MSRKLFKIKFIYVASLTLLTIILIYFLFYQNINNNYDEFIVVKAIEPYDDDDDGEFTLSNLVNFTNFQYKIKPDSLCNNFEDELLGKILHNFFFLNPKCPLFSFYTNLIFVVRCYHCNIVCWP